MLNSKLCSFNPHIKFEREHEIVLRKFSDILVAEQHDTTQCWPQHVQCGLVWNEAKYLLVPLQNTAVEESNIKEMKLTMFGSQTEAYRAHKML
jgi:hypothetical protein